MLVIYVLKKQKNVKLVMIIKILQICLNCDFMRQKLDQVIIFKMMKKVNYTDFSISLNRNNKTKNF